MHSGTCQHLNNYHNYKSPNSGRYGPACKQRSIHSMQGAAIHNFSMTQLQLGGGGGHTEEMMSRTAAPWGSAGRRPAACTPAASSCHSLKLREKYHRLSFSAISLILLQCIQFPLKLRRGMRGEHSVKHSPFPTIACTSSISSMMCIEKAAHARAGHRSCLQPDGLALAEMLGQGLSKARDLMLSF